MRASNQDFVDYYRVLGVHPEATQQEIREAFRREAMRWHPDRNPSADAAEKIRLVNEAWEVLGDVAQRARYDRDSQFRTSSRNNSGRSSAHDGPRTRPCSEGGSFGARSATVRIPKRRGEWKGAELFRAAMAGVFVILALVAFAVVEIAQSYLSSDVYTWFTLFVFISSAALYWAFIVTLCVHSRNEGENSLHRLIKRGEADHWKIQKLLDSAVPASARDTAGETPLTLAAKAGASAEVLSLLATPLATARSRSALYWLIASSGAGSTNEDSRIESLVEAGILLPRSTNLWQWMVEQARTYRDAYKDKNERWDRYRGLELHTLLSRRQVRAQTVETLVRAGASLKDEDGLGRTPLEIALEMRHPREIVELLSP